MLDRRPLLPADQYLAAMLWPDEDPKIANQKYKIFLAEVESQVKIDPAKPQAGMALGAIALVTGIISVGLTVVASFFKPKGQEPGQGGITATEKQGATITSTSRVAPRIGFDAVQQPSDLGMTVPVIWARRQSLPAQASPPRPAGVYGGVRVNLGLIWSQMVTYQGSHLLRAVFLVGEGPVGIPDPNGYAIGDNSLGTYQISNSAVRELVSRATIYVSPESGPIRSIHRVIGRAASQDVGNSENYGASTVFSIRGSSEEYTQDFCYTTKPSTSTTFGVYSHMPNGTGYRVNPRIRPTLRVTTKTLDNGEKFKVDCDDDPQALADHWKARYQFSMRSGIIETSNGSENLAPGDWFRYKLDRRSDINTVIVFNSENTDNTEGESDGEASCTDVANYIASKQRSADDALVVGEIYKAGSCLAILIERVPGDRVFVSNSDNEPATDGQSMEYVFRVIRAGQVGLVDNDYLDPDWSGERRLPPRWNRSGSLNSFDIPDQYRVCSDFPQIYRCAIATKILDRSARIFEIGIKSRVGITINGLCNFRDCRSLREINENAGQVYEGRTYDKNDKIGVTNFQSGTIQRSETRISFFRIEFRHGNEEWEALDGVWGIKSSSSEDLYNQIRFEMPLSRRWEVRFEPLTSYEIRRDSSLPNPFLVISSKSNNRHRTIVNDGIVVEWYGEEVDKARRNFNLPNLDPREDIGIPGTENNSVIDDWAMIAESFVYGEIQSSIESGPEHEIIYANTISVNPADPVYNDIATIGLNIFASTEFRQLPQFSAYFTDGISTRRTREYDALGSTNLFPDILRAYLTNDRYGRGSVIGDILVDSESFATAAEWCQKRRYFYDSVDVTRTNLLQWAADTASQHLLELNQRGGRWALTQAVYFPEDGPVPVRALFTAGNIVENTFKIQFLQETERQPIRMSVKWREERQKSDLTSGGFFPVDREIFIQEAGQSESDPIESIDLGNFCTNPEHAIDIACYYIRMRRLITHTISFSTTPDGLGVGLAAGDYVKVAMDLSYFDQFANGVVTADGTVFSTRMDLLTEGDHQIMAWDGASDFIYDTTLTIDADGKASPVGIVFAKRATLTDVRVYKIEKISISEDGLIDVDAVHHPCDSYGISEIGKNWTTYQTDSNWIIEGNEVEADFCTCPLVIGQAIPGNTLTVGDVVCNSGVATKIGVQWFRDYMPIDGATSSSYTLTAGDTGKLLFAEIAYQTPLGEVHSCRSFAEQGDPYYDSIVLLLHMDGDHNSRVFVDSSPYEHNAFVTPVSVSETNSGPEYIAARMIRWNGRFGGSSAFYYNATFGGPYTFPSYTHPTAFQIASNQDFTVECWIWRFSSSSYGKLASVFGFDFEIRFDKIRATGVFPNNGWNIQTSTIEEIQSWIHVALVRSNGVVAIYVNGISRASGLASFASTSTTCSVGGSLGSSSHLQDEVRITKGIARYTGSFVPPDSAFFPAGDNEKPQQSTVVLYHFNGTNNSVVIENDTVFTGTGGTATGNTYISTTESRFGGSSLYLGGSNTLVVGGISLPNVYTIDYTIDFWIRPLTKAGIVFSKYGECRWSNSQLVYIFNGITHALENPSAGSITQVNTWSHVAISRQGPILRLFLDGVLTNTYTSSTVVSVPGIFNTMSMYIGGGAYDTSTWSGYLDEFRVVFGGALFTSSFTPPTQPYQTPAD